MPKPFLFSLTSEDRSSAIDKLVSGAAPDASFYLLLVLSTIIVTLGLQLDSASVVIGGMLVAPIMSPILSFAMSIVMADFEVLKQSSKVLLASIVSVLVIALIIGLVSLDQQETNEIITRVNPSMRYFLVAITSGVAAAFALARPSLSEAIPGIAVSVALLPPLAVVSLGIALSNAEIAIGALLLFFLNLLGIVLAATVIFSLMGFYEQRKVVERELDKKLEENQAK